ncbi:N-acetylmuramoyl-L-alanine amidase [Streptomyces sp. KL116D]|uniref:N-acetylmuramoyl-L-alanine amidase n=1 Tax=Streptomyces sp. KL116D TaxID=3045152 RepID=UPI00355790CE
MVPTQNLAYHAGNYVTNMHSVGIEHEGFAAQGATWYTETQYRATADLVKYLAARLTYRSTASTSSGTTTSWGPTPSLASGSTGTRDRSGTGTTSWTCSARPSTAGTASVTSGPP